MYGVFALVASLTAAILFYFPSKPKLPPSQSSAVQRMEFLPGLRAMCWYVQGDNGGQRLHFDGFIFEVPRCCPTDVHCLPDLQLPEQNQADSQNYKIAVNKS